MELSQQDRDALRTSQYNINPNVIGNLIEHKPQNPRGYKKVSIKPQDDEHKSAQIVQYESKYINRNSSKPQQAEQLDTAVEQHEVLEDLLQESQAKSWLNMNNIEFDKLEWMSAKAEKVFQDKLQSSTHFDKDGKPVPRGSVPTDQATHDIPSLVQLLDSQYSPQVTYSLNVISRIAVLATIGYYDGAFDENIHEYIINKCLLRVRHHMDSSNESVCQSAIRCMKSLICNTQIDEIVLDRIHPLITQTFNANLWLDTVELEEKEFTIDMKDQECIEKDVILALIDRTKILERMEYLLDHQKDHIYAECILDILIRMVRHSHAVCAFLSRKDLITSILKKFIKPSVVSESSRAKTLTIKSLKLLRIICDASFETHILVDKVPDSKPILLKTIDPILAALEVYILIEWYKEPENYEQSARLHIETLRLMKSLCRLKQFRKKIISITALVRDSLLGYYKFIMSLDAKKILNSKISLEWQYAGHMIDFTGTVLKNEHCHDINGASSLSVFMETYIRTALLQWISDVVNEKFIPHIDISMTIATALFYFDHSISDNSTRTLVLKMIDHIVQKHMKLTDTQCRETDVFMILAMAASEKSQLSKFASHTGKLRDPKVLPSYGCLNYNTSNSYSFQLSPVFDTYSPFIMLNTFIDVLQMDKVDTTQNLGVFIDNICLARYLRSLASYHSYESNYETLVQYSLLGQYEVQIVSKCIVLLTRYYLNFNKGPGQEASDLDPPELMASKVECYNDLCHYSIRAIGLLNPNAVEALELKDKLLEKVLLDSRIQSRLSQEANQKLILDNVTKVLDPSNTKRNFSFLDSHQLNLLNPLYTTCDQPDRFWIFQPLLLYYYCVIKETQPDEKKEAKYVGDRWFLENLPWRTITAEVAMCNDANVIEVILYFNFILMHFSPSYLHIAVKPNVEHLLCVIGIVFLDDNLFLDEKVQNALRCNLERILQVCLEEQQPNKYLTPFKSASSVIKPLDLTVGDFFNKIVDQFEAVSYGSIAFSNFLLLFMATGADKLFRRKLFQERADTCLRQLRMAEGELWSPRAIFFSEREKDPEIKNLIRRFGGANLRAGSFLAAYREFHMS